MFSKLRITTLIFFVFIIVSSFASTSIERPLIGISGNIKDSHNFPGYSYSYVGNTYVKSIVRADGAPVIIPVTENKAVVSQLVKHLDGLILTGGQDVNPMLYNEEPSVNIGAVNHVRDSFDFELLKIASKNKIPVLGICRGSQLMNVFFGGTLHQDIPTSIENPIDHRQKQAYDFGTHTVLIKKGSWISKVWNGKETKVVNSFHHQSVKDVAPGFKVTAMAKDGVIEGIERTKGSFCVGIQWHPEMMHERDAEMLKIYKDFVDVCKNYQDKNRVNVKSETK